MTPRLLRNTLAASILCLPGIAQSAFAQSQTPSGPTLEAKASEAHAAAEKELANIRARIEAEKVPLHQRLTAIEDELAATRKTYDDRRKIADLLALESSNVATEVKVRSDENAYLANLLDEFVRGFESRIHAGEVATYSERISAAKLAVENPNLEEKERFEKRMEVLNASMDRILDVIGGKRLETELLDTEGVLTKGLLVLLGPVAVFGSNDKSTYGIVAAQAGSDRPVLRSLGPDMTPGIAQLVETGEGILPFDPTRGAALQALLKKTSIVDTFLHGGPIMWPILLCSIIAVAISLERIFFVLREKTKRRQADIESIYDHVSNHAILKAVTVGKKSTDFVARMLGYALDHREKSLHAAVQRGSQLEVKRFTRGMWILDTCITMAPLLGLLGTVTGMMASFEAIGASSDAATGANAVIGGIAEALIATAAGLLIAILALIPLNYMNDTIEAVQHELDDAAKRLELLLHPSPQLVIAGEGSTGGGHGIADSPNKLRPEEGPLRDAIPEGV